MKKNRSCAGSYQISFPRKTAAVVHEDSRVTVALWSSDLIQEHFNYKLTLEINKLINKVAITTC